MSQRLGFIDWFLYGLALACVTVGPVLCGYALALNMPRAALHFSLLWGCGAFVRRRMRDIGEWK